MHLRLFNDTELNEIRRTSAQDIPLGVQIYLALGGFTGRITEEGSQATVRTPGGATITVQGTEFFVTYDSATGQTTVGNFNGTVEVNSAGVSTPVEKGYFVIVPSDERPGPPILLATSFDQYEEKARELHSPIAASQAVGDWTLSLEYQHDLLLEESEVLWCDTKGNSQETFPPENSLVTWSGTFVVEGAMVIGQGKGEVEGNFICPLLAGTECFLFENFEIHGTFTFNIRGILTEYQGKQVINIYLEGENFSVMSTVDQIEHENAELCTGGYYFHDYYENLVVDTNKIVGDIELELRDGASLTLMDIEPPFDDRAAQVEVKITQASSNP
jgi:hypothetical protein